MEDGKATRTSIPMLFLTAVLALLGVRTFTSDSGALLPKEPKHFGERKVPAESVASDEKTRPSDRFWQPLLDYQDTYIGDNFAQEIEHLSARLPDFARGEVRCLIACVPDPVESSSKYRFDGLIDAIQRAAETQGYVYDRSFYPWQTPNRETSKKLDTDADSAELESASLRLASASKKRRGSPTHQPGVLLLRTPAPHMKSCVRCCVGLFGLSSPATRNGSFAATAAAIASVFSPRLLLVFLVGETATAGIDKKAFMAALHLVCQSQDYSQNHQVNVLGPHFSGSQTSLEKIIRAWGDHEKQSAHKAKRKRNSNGQTDKSNESKLEFRIISGNATSIDKCKLEGSCASVRVTFQATVAPDDDVMDALLEYLNLGHCTDKGLEYKDSFAVLHESNTTFGQRTAEHSDAGQQRSRKRSGPTLFPFPLHISEVRSAYSKSAGGSSSEIQRLPSFGSQLQLPTAEESRSSDVEPSLDSSMTAVTSERLLAQMLETISRERFRYVFILATDVKDTLFLARLIRQQCPESRLVFTYSDLLFSHPDFSSYLRGSIVGSFYPLYHSNQRWSFPFQGDKKRLFFPGAGEQGYYNATIALLDEMPSKSMVEYGPPFPSLYPSFPANQSYVWISIIGQDALYPVSIHRNNKQSDYVLPASRSSTEEIQKSGAIFVVSHSGLLAVPMIGMMLLLIYVGLSYFAVVYRRAEWEQESARGGGTEMQRLFWPRSSSGLRRRQRFYTSVCLTSVMVVYSYLAFVWLLPVGHRCLLGEISPVEVHDWHWIMAVLLLFLLLSFLAGPFLRAYQLLPTQERPAADRTANLGETPQSKPAAKVESEGGARASENVNPTSSHTTSETHLSKDTPGEQAQADTNLPAMSAPQARRAHLRTLISFIGRRYLILLILFLIGLMAAYLYFNGRAPRWWWEHPGECLLFAARASNLANGVSPVVPILLIGLAFFIWGYAQLRRLYLLDRHSVPALYTSEKKGELVFKRLFTSHSEVRRRLGKPRLVLESVGGTVIWMLLFFTLSRLSSHFVPAAEDVLTEVPILLSLAVLAVLIVYGWMHLCKVWQRTNRVLMGLALLSLHDAFARIPLAITSLFGPYLTSQKPRNRDITDHQLRQRRILSDEYKEIADDLAAELKLDENQKNKLQKTLADKDAATLSATAQTCLVVLQQVNDNSLLAERLLAETKDKKEETKDKKVDASDDSQDKTPRIRLWLRHVQEFIALEVMIYLSQFSVQMRNLALSLSLLPLLMLLAVTSYPFQPQRPWLLLSVTLIVLVTLTVVFIVIGVERNELMSRIARTTPHQVNFHWNFLSHMLVYALPLLGVIVALSSDLSNLVHAWVDPLIQAMK